MSKPITVSIDTSSKQDIDDLMHNICANYLNMTITEAKRKHLGFFGKDAVIASKETSLKNIFDLCDKTGAKFKISVSYEKTSRNSEEILEERKRQAPDLNEGIRLCDAVNQLEKQKEDIINPDLTDIVKENVPGKVLENDFNLPSINFGKKDIPDFLT